MPQLSVVNWNCRMKFREKIYDVIERYDPTVMIVQECESPDKVSYPKEYNCLWVGERDSAGLGIFVRSKYDIEYNPSMLANPTPVYTILPVSVSVAGIEYSIIGVWAKKNMPRYIGQVKRLTDQLTDSTTVDIVAGDFNWNPNLDGKHSVQFRDVSSELELHNLQSVYHTQYNEEYGDETKSTFSNHTGKFHTDYLYLNSKYCVNSFGVDKTDESDHTPLYMCIE